jgi:predicted nucleotidyltransferase
MNKIKYIFFKNPEKEHHVRHIAKQLNISPTSASKYLKELEKKEILTSEKKYGHLIFRANTESKKYQVLKRNNNILSLYDSGLINFLQKTYNYPEAIILFGSYSKGEDTSRSDIDLLIITPAKKEHKLEKFEKKLGRKIQIFEISKEELIKTNANLKNSWINGIVLEGYIEIQ